ncbi:hypothetical protein PN417_12310 [Halorubrum ezzemoulense]|uniref:hypothetical protein n=1 Tax=Halorubrum ezzemoulense TaxID=337243 RepID=UPI00232C9CA9|nr:hypothetical protein [Halorubrum ezzemoulense]MDB9301719.1 hypothetical protein [Halorubrum ezzemoulense]
MVDTDGFGGLFGQTGASGSPGEVTDLGLEDVDISGEGSVGALLGPNSATITNVYVTGDIQGGNGTLPTTGGPVGMTNGNISRSFSAATVEGPDNVGGLVGKTRRRQERNHTLPGSVNVTGRFPGGCLVGDNNLSGATVTNPYPTEEVSAGIGAGGPVGYAANGDLKDSYWDTDVTDDSTAVDDGSLNATYLTTAQLQRLTATDNINGFDFTNVWQTNSGDYLTLR